MSADIFLQRQVSRKRRFFLVACQDDMQFLFPLTRYFCSPVQILSTFPWFSDFGTITRYHQHQPPPPKRSPPFHTDTGDSSARRRSVSSVAPHRRRCVTRGAARRVVRDLPQEDLFERPGAVMELHVVYGCLWIIWNVLHS